VAYPDHVSEVHESWAEFVRIPSYRQYKLVDMMSLTDYVLKIIMTVPDFDVIYSFSSGPFFELIAVLISQMSNKPSVMHINGNGALARGFFMDKTQKLKEDAVDLLALNNVDAIVPISSNLEEVMKNLVLNPERVRSPMPFCVDFDAFPPGPLPDKLCIGYAGRISPEKGTDFLIDVMRETPEVRYRLAGPIEKMTGTFPDNASYKGTYDHHEMKYFYYLCNILALPSYGEGISAQILESYACGRGIICTPEAHPEELPVIGYELPLEAELWRTKFRSLDVETTAKIGREARDWIKDNWPSWDEFGVGMSTIFNSVSRK